MVAVQAETSKTIEAACLAKPRCRSLTLMNVEQGYQRPSRSAAMVSSAVRPAAGMAVAW